MSGRGFSPMILRKLLFRFLRLRGGTQAAIVVLVLILATAVWFAQWQRKNAPQTPSPGSASDDASHPASHGPKSVVFCLWNLENLFDDVDDKRREPDAEFDSWFANDPAARARKYRRIAEALVALNGGHGPDIILGNEVESHRAATLLQEDLNSLLPAEAARYEHVGMKELDAGRHIAPCVISRYPISGVKLLGKRQRILEFHVAANGHDLHVIGSHWTSQRSDKGEDPTRGRHAYASAIHSAYSQALRENPQVDMLVAGDFNDSPDAPSVAGYLNVTGDRIAVTPGTTPAKLYGLLSTKLPSQFGTIFYSGKPYIYDQIAISPGLLDRSGWNCDIQSVAAPTGGLIRQGTSGRRPWRFGSKNAAAVGRGFSDHFPVMVTLNVAP